MINSLVGVAFIAIGVAMPILVLYALWGWVGVVCGGLVAAVLILGACCVLTGLKRMP